MISNAQSTWLLQLYNAAREAKHIWPVMAASEGRARKQLRRFGTREMGEKLVRSEETRSVDRSNVLATNTRISAWAVGPRTGHLAGVRELRRCMTERMNVLRSNGCYARHWPPKRQRNTSKLFQRSGRLTRTEESRR